jgi:YidC/Oxa1 family membrane protein insertase
MEERRLLIAVALSLLVLTAYQFLFPPVPPPAPRAVASPAAGGPVPAPGAGSPTPGPGGTATAPAAQVQPAPAATPLARVADERERRIEVQSPEVSAAFTNKGARLLSWRLERFRDRRSRPEEMVQTVAGGPLPLDLETGDPTLDARLREALFLPSAEALKVDGRPSELRFRFVEGDLEAEKVIRFAGTGYGAELQASVKRAGQEMPLRILWGPGVANPTAEEMDVQGYHAPQGVYLDAHGVTRLPDTDIKGTTALGGVRWAGVESQYFAALLVPAGGAGAELRALSLGPGPDGQPRTGVQAALPLSPGAPTLLYVGPKDHALLASAGHDLAQVVPVGEWIGPIVVPLLALLRWAYRQVGNYGGAIILLTVLINLIMAPLRHYSIANGLKMAKLAPEMRVIQDRYRKVPALDPKRQEMQAEIGALYARHGMSMGTQMAVGCVPLLLTMPFLIAFYRVLQVAIELRGASFLWLPDLSQKDPLFLTPVLMGASMVLMQKMTPSAMDPAQQRIMMIMPLVLVVMFFAAPAGLNLYWLASNVCSIIQQGITLKLLQGGETKGKGKHA